MASILPSRCRWIGGNEYTTYSAVYTDCFGQAVAFSEVMRQQVYPQDKDGVLKWADYHADILLECWLPSPEERKKSHLEAMVSLLKSYCFTSTMTL